MNKKEHTPTNLDYIATTSVLHAMTDPDRHNIIDTLASIIAGNRAAQSKELVEALEAAENELDWAYSNAQPIRNSRAQADKEAVELGNVLCKVRAALAKVKGESA